LAGQDLATRPQLGQRVLTG